MPKFKGQGRVEDLFVEVAFKVSSTTGSKVVRSYDPLYYALGGGTWR
jgi:hypothetical protein